MILRKNRGMISFIALVLIIICSLFVFYFVDMNNTHYLGQHVKRGLDRSTKAASAIVNEELLSKGYFKIDEQKSKDIFEKMINLNLGTGNLIKLSPIKQNNGINYVFQYNGYENIFTNKSKLEKTPKITYFVFNSNSNVVSNNPNDINNFISYIKQTLKNVQISDDLEDDIAIKNAIMAELAAKDMNDLPVNREAKIKDTRSFVLAVSEIPVDTFRGSLKRIYRFSTSRLNSKVDTPQDHTTVVIHGLKGEYYRHDIPEDVSPPTTKAEKLAERIDKEINFQWGTYPPHPNLNADGYTIIWTGLIKAPITGLIQFRTITDDGVRLWVDNTLIIDKWRQQSPTAWDGTITLTKDKWYPIRMEYYENTGNSVAQLMWKYQGRNDFEIIPSSYLLPYETNYNGNAEYYSKTFTIKEPLGIKRFGEIIEVPIIFDYGKMVKNTTNMTLLNGTRKIPFVMKDIIKTSSGYIKKGKLIFVDDLEPNEAKTYNLVFSDSITYIPPSSGIVISSDSNYITIRNNNFYTLKFKKKSRAGYSQAYVNGNSYDVIGERPTRNFYFSSKNKTSGWDDWADLSSFKIIENNAVYTTVEYKVKDVTNTFQYNLKATYYKNSPIIKHTFNNTNISSNTLYSYIYGHTPMFERSADIEGIAAWGVDNNYNIIEGNPYNSGNNYLATGTAFWSNTRNYQISLHTRRGIAKIDMLDYPEYNGGRICLFHDNEQELLNPNESSKEIEFWMSVSHKDYLGDGKKVAQNITLRMANPIILKTEDTISILDKPNPPIIVPSKTGIIKAGEEVKFSIKDNVDQNGNLITDVQWEGLTYNNRYRGGVHTIKARVKNSLGVWSDWAEYDFTVKFKLLEIYPFKPQIKDVLDKYATGMVEVISMSIDDFNKNKPNINQYDMLMFGFADCYGGKDISDYMAQKVEDYIKNGGGVLFSHDTIWGKNKNFTKYFAKYLNLDISESHPNGFTGTNWWNKSPVYKIRNGKLTEYPYKLGDTIEIQPSHWQWFKTGADVWYAADPNDPNGTWFVVSNQNVVHITSGHYTYTCSGGLNQLLKNAPEDEQKLLVNTIYYTSRFRKTNIIEQPTGKISINGPNSPGVYYRGDKIKFKLYDLYLPNGDIKKYEWVVKEKFGLHKTYTFNEAEPEFIINAQGDIIPEYEVQVKITDVYDITSNWIKTTFTVSNRPPKKPTIAMNLTGNIRNGNEYEIIIGASSLDPDGDTVTYEWQGKQENNYYAEGTYTIKVRAKDSHGQYSAWTIKTFDTKDPMRSIFEDWVNYYTNNRSGEWYYDENKKWLYSTKNVWWSGYWNPDDINLKNYKLSFDMAQTPRDGDDDSIGMTFRMKDENNYYFFSLDNRGSNGGAIHSGLYKVVNGKRIRLVDLMPMKWVANTWYHIDIEVIDNRIKIWKDGTLIVDYTDNNNPFLNGAYGPFTYSQAYGAFKKISLTIIN